MTTEDEIINNIKTSVFDEKNDFFGFEASKRKVFIIREDNRISSLEAKIKYAANRVFVNHGDSYHGKYIIQEISQVPFMDIEYIGLDNVSVDRTNEEFKKRESNIDDEDSQQNQNAMSNEIMATPNKRSIENNNLQLATINNDVEANKILNSITPIGSHVSNIQVQSIISMENIPMYSVRKPKIKVNKQEIKPMKYDIVTTMKNKSHYDDKKYGYLKKMKKLIIPNDKKLLMQEIKKCAVVVYDISLDKNQIIEANIALKKIIEEVEFMKKNPKKAITKQSRIRVFILISSIQTWALTKKKNEVPLAQSDYKHRICHPNFRAHYNLENNLLLLNDKYQGYFYGIVLASGLVYGRGECTLKYIYKTVFCDMEQLLIPKSENNLPIIYVGNLAKIVKNLVVHYDKVIKPYIVGIETSKFSLRKITEVIRDEVHKKNYMYCGYNSLILNSMVTQNVFDMVTMDIHIVPIIDNYITKFMSLDQSIPSMFTKTTKLISEYLQKSLKIKNIIIYGPHKIRHFAKKLAYTYNLNFIDPVTISEEFMHKLETNVNNNAPLTWLEDFKNENIQNSSENKQNNVPNLDNKQLLKEQKENVEKTGKISDKYLLPFIKNKILSNNRGNACGYIISNFPETTEQAQQIFNLEIQLVSKDENNVNLFQNEINPSLETVDQVQQLFNLETQLVSKDENDVNLFQNEINPTIIIDVIMVSNEHEIMKHNTLENNNLEIRKNELVDHLEVLIKPKIYKEYILSSQKDFGLTDQDKIDRLFDSLLISMPVKTEEVEDEIIYRKILLPSKKYDTHLTITTNLVLENNETEEKNVTQLLSKESTIIEEHLSLEHKKIINFLITCVNPILVNGILEIIKDMPEDPIDFLVEYIYNHNTHNPCVSSTLNKNQK